MSIITNQDLSIPLTEDQAKHAQRSNPSLRSLRAIERVRQNENSIAAAIARLNSLGSGIVAHATYPYTGQPTAEQTVTIGANVYQFITEDGAVTNNAYIAVQIGSTADDTWANFALAINRTYSPNQHPNITNIATTAPALANGTENVLAVHVPASDIIYLYAADAPGGNKVQGIAPNIALSRTASNAGPWSRSNLNLAVGGAFAPATKVLDVRHAVIAGDLSATQPLLVAVPFTPQSWDVKAYKSTGVPVQTPDVVVTVPAAVSGQAFLGLNLGAATVGMTPLVATDVLFVTIRGA